MTAGGAKKILFDYVGTGPEAEPVDFDEACRLGAQALKREEQNRDNPHFVMVGLLPGETEE